MDYGAKGDEVEDDSQILGTIKAPSSPESWDGRDASQWLAFRGVNGLKVEGGGIIDGQGKKWWDQSCRYHPDLKGCTKLAPTAMKFVLCNNSSVSNIQFSSSPQTHALIFGCNGFNVSHVESGKKRPPESSKKTPVPEKKVKMATPQKTGKSGNFVQVEDIHVYNCTFNGTTNGARIKTWQASGVEISDVVYQNISGTARRETAINLKCSRSVPCTEIRMESIDITAQAASGTVAAYCSNARGQESVVEPGPCLQQL
nr:polygalacturonase QRT2-like [Ipomoea trifida]